MSTYRKSQRDILRHKFKNKYISKIFKNIKASQTGIKPRQKKKRNVFQKLFGFNK